LNYQNGHPFLSEQTKNDGGHFLSSERAAKPRRLKYASV